MGYRVADSDFLSPSTEGQIKNLYTKSERPIRTCRMNWAWSEKFNLYNGQMMILPRKTKYMQPSRTPVICTPTCVMHCAVIYVKVTEFKKCPVRSEGLKNSLNPHNWDGSEKHWRNLFCLHLQIFTRTRAHQWRWREEKSTILRNGEGSLTL